MVVLGLNYVDPESVLARTAWEMVQTHAGGLGPHDGMTICPVCGDPLPCAAGRAAAEVLAAAGLAESSGLTAAARNGLGPQARDPQSPLGLPATPPSPGAPVSGSPALAAGRPAPPGPVDAGGQWAPAEQSASATQWNPSGQSASPAQGESAGQSASSGLGVTPGFDSPRPTSESAYPEAPRPVGPHASDTPREPVLPLLSDHSAQTFEKSAPLVRFV